MGNTFLNFSKLRWALFAFSGVFACATAFAQEKAVSIDNAVYQEIPVKRADGTIEMKRVAATKVVPGNDVIYEIHYRNEGKAVATDVAIGSPVPQELAFVDDSKSPASEVSVDGGKHFGKLADLKVADEEGKQRPAQAADVTNLRWNMASLAPGAQGKVEFRARVK